MIGGASDFSSSPVSGVLAMPTVPCLYHNDVGDNCLCQGGIVSRIGTTGGIALLLALLPIAADAACAPRDKAVQQLTDDFGEVRQSIGLSGNNTIVEVYANLETGTWTIVQTNANGISCMVAAGAYFSILHEELQGEAL